MIEFKIDDVAVIKLITGEELIGLVKLINDKEIHLDNILTIVYQLDQDTKRIGYGLLPYNPLSGKMKEFQRTHIVYYARPTEQLTSVYKQQTSNLVTPSKQLITG